MSKEARFNELSASYEELLRHPIRDLFTSGGTFFHRRKAELILDYFRRHAVDTSRLAYLDLGCGKGELVACLRSHFVRIAGCDVSAEMMKGIEGVETRVQNDAQEIPFPDSTFDLVTAVCVYHHVPPENRLALSSEVVRVLKPGGVFAVVEHNPFNPVTRLIVSRTPVDADAILLRPRETRHLMRDASLAVHEQEFFLYLPVGVYRRIPGIERMLRGVPLGGQYAVFARKFERGVA
jgi:SAM-dependent methyltransferase